MRAVFADCHVGRRPGDEGPFLEALETARERGATRHHAARRHLPLLHRPPEVRDAGDRALSRGRPCVSQRSGLPVTYVEGNRDFFLRGSYAETRFARSGRGDLRGGRAAVSRDPRRPAERARPRLPLLAVPVEEPGLARRARVVPKDAAQPARLEGRGAPLPLQLQAQVAASGRDDPGLRRAAVPRGHRRPPARPLPQVLDGDVGERPRRDPAGVRRGTAVDGDRRTTARRRSCRSSTSRGATSSRFRRPRRLSRPNPRPAVEERHEPRPPRSPPWPDSPVEIVRPLESDDTARAAPLPRALGATFTPTPDEACGPAGRWRGLRLGEIRLARRGDSGTAARFLPRWPRPCRAASSSTGPPGCANGRWASSSQRCARAGGA